MRVYIQPAKWEHGARPSDSYARKHGGKCACKNMHYCMQICRQSAVQANMHAGRANWTQRVFRHL